MVDNICRVCGLDEDDERWKGQDGAQYASCLCCGAESGVDDVDLRWDRDYRSTWIAVGCAGSPRRSDRPSEILMFR
jgi:hypothetical protein